MAEIFSDMNITLATCMVGSGGTTIIVPKLRTDFFCQKARVLLYETVPYFLSLPIQPIQTNRMRLLRARHTHLGYLSKNPG